MDKTERDKLKVIYDWIRRDKERAVANLCKQQRVLLELIAEKSLEVPVYEYANWRSNNAYSALLSLNQALTELHFLLGTENEEDDNE